MNYYSEQQLEQAAEAELQRVLHVQYDSREICGHFWTRLRNRLRSQLQPQRQKRLTHEELVVRWERAGAPCELSAFKDALRMVETELAHKWGVELELCPAGMKCK